MNKKRLLKLADFLETVPRKAFDMGAWVAHEPSKPEGDEPGECGFAGCAMGWAAHAKLFPGLTLRKPWSGGRVAYGSARGFGAAEALFDIDAHGAEFLFDAWVYESRNPTPKQVAKRIRKFVETGSI